MQSIHPTLSLKSKQKYTSTSEQKEQTLLNKRI
jgi:hypothetical protein